MCQTNGDGGIQVYAFACVPETWYKNSGIDFSSPEARRQVIDPLYSDWDLVAKQLVFRSGAQTAARPLYTLPMNLTWQQNPR